MLAAPREEEKPWLPPGSRGHGEKHCGRLAQAPSVLRLATWSILWLFFLELWLILFCPAVSPTRPANATTTTATTTAPKSSDAIVTKAQDPAVLLKLCLLVAKCLREDTAPASSIQFHALRFFPRRHHWGQWRYFGPQPGGLRGGAWRTYLRAFASLQVPRELC